LESLDAANPNDDGEGVALMDRIADLKAPA
jgi:hypothetical protein